MRHLIVNPQGKPYTSEQLGVTCHPRKQYQITIIDLCGRQEPCTIDAYDPDQIAATFPASDLTPEDFDHIFEMHDRGDMAFIGEFEYRKAA